MVCASTLTLPDFKPRLDLEQLTPEDICESVFAELTQTNSKNIIVGCLYKPPDIDVNTFNDHIQVIVNKLSFENKLCYLMGDFNINLLNTDSHNPTNEFTNLLFENSLYPVISKPTRITHHSATLIDNIFTNNLDHDMISGIIYSDLSDHLPIFQTSNLKIENSPQSTSYKVRKITSNNIEIFRAKLTDTDWSVLDDSNTSPDQSYNYFSSLLATTYL